MLNKLWLPLGVLVLSLALPNAGWAQPNDFEGFPTEAELNRFNLNRRWHTTVPVMRLREELTTLKVMGGMLFAQTNQGVIHCYDAETGQFMWSATLADFATVTHLPTVQGNYVYVATGYKLTQLDRATGRINWWVELPMLTSAGPAANDNFVYVPTTGGRIHAITVKPDNRRIASGKHPIAWFYQADGAIDDQPIVLPDRMVFVSDVGTVHAAHPDGRRFFYQFYTYAQTTAPLSSLDRLVYMASSDFSLYAIDLLRGSMKWRYLSGYPINTKPIPYLEDVFVTPTGLGLVCLDNQNGVVRWINENISRLIAVSREYVYGADELNKFVILGRKDGKVIGSWNAPTFSISTDNQYSDRVYMGTAQGLVVCLHEKQNEKPYLHPQTFPRTVIEEESATASPTDETGKKKERRSFFDDDLMEEAKPKKRASFFGDDEPEKKETEKTEKKTKKRADFFGDDPDEDAKPKAKPKSKSKSKSKASKEDEDGAMADEPMG